MFAVSDEDAVAIRAAFERGGEFAAAVELRRRFPLIEDNAQARMHARIIAGWQSLTVPLHPARPPRTRPRNAGTNRERGARARESVEGAAHDGDRA